MNHYEVLREKIKKGKANVGIIGLGYVGLPLVKLFLKNNFRVYGFDIDKKKIEKLKKGISYIEHIDFCFFREKFRQKKFKPSSDFKKLKEVNAIIICVPTPLNKKMKPDLKFVKNTVREISKNFKEGTLIVLESTTYPGTTREVILPVFEKKGLKIGEDFFLAFSPEREDPGNKKFTTKNIPKVVGGMDKNSTDIACLLYSKVVDRVIRVSSPEVAEATKMLENTFRAVNIALVNELKMFFQKAGIDIWEVIEASKTKPFGFMPFYPGPGWGGHCIPVDPFYLYWRAKKSGIDLNFIKYAGEINIYMPYYVIKRLENALMKNGKKLKGSRILLLGVAYKRDIDDIRESPALIVFDILEKRGADVFYYDPYVRRIESKRYKRVVDRVKDLRSTVKNSDAVIVLTDHTNVDYGMILKEANLIIDTRNVFQRIEGDKSKVIKA